MGKARFYQQSTADNSRNYRYHYQTIKRIFMEEMIMENNNINIYVEQREKRAPVADPNLKYLVEIMKMSTPTKPVVIVNPMDELRYKKLLTVNEAAQLFGVGINKIRSLTEDDECPFVIWIGAHRRIKRVEFEHYLDTQFSI